MHEVPFHTMRSLVFKLCRFFLVVVESHFELCVAKIFGELSLTSRCMYEHVGIYHHGSEVPASKQLAIKQPVLTDKELELINSIV